MKTSKKALRVEDRQPREQIAAITREWQKRGIAEGEYATRKALLDRRAVITEILYPGTPSISF